MDKLILGTAQFGMDYGISNKRGKIPKKEVFEILNEALKAGINALDTAPSYGKGEIIIGEFIKQYKKQFNIVSKLPKCNPSDANKIIEFSLKQLNVQKLSGYIIHSFQNYIETPQIWNILKRLKLEGKTEKIGFSLYFPYELEFLLKNGITLDIIQVPYSIFDQRFLQYFPDLKSKNTEIHVRSIFLQGLAFQKPDNLNGYFAKIKEKIINLNSLSFKLEIPIVALCLNFTVLTQLVDKVIIGVDSIENFKEIVDSFKYTTKTKNLISKLKNFREDDEKIIVPINWGKKSEHNCNNTSKNWFNKTSEKSFT